MREILFLAHRVPYPPDKGDKIRSWNMLKWLTARAPVHLGAFVDDPADMAHEAFLRGVCASVKLIPVRAASKPWRALKGLAIGQPLSVALLRDAAMTAWVRATLEANPVDALFAFSGQMAPYILPHTAGRRSVMDLVDLDSEKWAQYAAEDRGPRGMVYARESRRLLAFEAEVAAKVDATLFVSKDEAALFRTRAGVAGGRVHPLSNGVDLDYFSPDAEFARAPAEDHDLVGPLVVFVGAMDYRPNIDAARWFVAHVWPAVRKARPEARFLVVGSKPGAETLALGTAPGVTVTGRVADVRPFLAAADVVVAPLQIARGIQNKVLEAMAMGRAVVATPQAREGIAAEPGRDLLVQSDAPEFAATCLALLADPVRAATIGRAARARMEAAYTWDANLRLLGRLLLGDAGGRARAGGGMSMDAETITARAFDHGDDEPALRAEAATRIADTAAAPGVRGWPRALAAWGALLAGLGLVLRHDLVHLVTRWWNSHTYGHCLLIPPIIAWLIWQRRAGLAKLAPQPWLPGVALMLGAGIVWLVGEMAGVALVRHIALVLLLQFSVPTVFGLAVARGVLFPLGLAFFMIPVGEQLEPLLQTVTARFAMQLLHLFNVPAYNDGVFISIPNGDFQVAEACSGVRFLIAMVAFGALVSNVCFLSVKRRLWFMVAAVILPIVANGIRAWGTIYIAHLTTPQFARGVDHIVYGWIFFAIVMAMLLAVGWRFFDRPIDDPFIDPLKLQRPGTPPASTAKLAVAAGLAFAAASAAPAYAALQAARADAHPTRAVAIATPPGWTRVAYRGVPWRPSYKGASAQDYASFVDAAGQPVDVLVAVFDRQYEGHELVGYGQGAIEPGDTDVWAWAANEADPAGGHAYQINKLGAARDVAQFYRVNGTMTGNPYTAKIEGLKARLLSGDPKAYALFVSAERVDPMVSARPAIDRFIVVAGPPERLIAASTVKG